MLKYVGGGESFFNIPARNVTEGEVKEIEARFGFKDLRQFLLSSGLYVEGEPATDNREED